VVPLKYDKEFLKTLEKSVSENVKIDDELYWWIDSEWLFRSVACAHKILTAISFKETAKKTFEMTSSPLLPFIGLYYASLHLGTAFLCLDCKTKIRDLKRIRHRRTVRLLRKNLIKSNIISERISSTIEILRDIREFINFDFLQEHATENIDISNLHEKFFEYYNLLEPIIDEFIEFINYITEYTEKHLNFPILGQIVVTIEEFFFNDLFRTYLSEDEEEQIIRFLINKQLATKE